MNWKEEVMDKLRKYDAMSNAAHAIPRELDYLKEEAYAIQAAQMDRTGGRNIRGHEDRLMNIVVKQQELEILLNNTENWLRLMDRALEKLPAWDRKILKHLYMESRPVSQVCQELGMERSSLYRHRDQALRELTLQMYGALES